MITIMRKELSDKPLWPRSRAYAYMAHAHPVRHSTSAWHSCVAPRLTVLVLNRPTRAMDGM